LTSGAAQYSNLPPPGYDGQPVLGIRCTHRAGSVGSLTSISLQDLGDPSRMLEAIHAHAP
jgi:hypothetical protein